MSLLKRAFLYVARKKTRSILLLLVTCVMSAFLLIGISIKSSADQAAKELRKSMGGSFIVKIDNNAPERCEAVTHESGYSYIRYKGPFITEEMLQSILAVEGVSGYTVNHNYMSLFVDLDLFPGMYADMYKDIVQNDYPDKEPPDRRADYQVAMNSTLLFGEKDSQMQEYFRSGALTLVSGRHLTKGDERQALISADMAKRNDLTIGDTFTVENKEGNVMISDDPVRPMGPPVELTVLGIFDVNFQQEISIFTTEDMIAHNYIFTDTDTYTQLREYRGIKEDSAYSELTFFVDDPQMSDRVLNKVRSLKNIEWDKYILKLDDSSYRASIKPLQRMSGFSAFLMTASVLGVLTVQYLILNMWTRGRRKEIGILLSIGIQKRMIRMQLILESVMICAAALMFALCIAGFASGHLGRLAERATAPDAGGDAFTVEYDTGELAPDIDKVSASPVQLSYPVSPANIFAVAVLTLGVTVLSVFLASIQALKMKPKDILSSI